MCLMVFYLDVKITRDDEQCFGGVGEEGGDEGCEGDVGSELGSGEWWMMSTRTGSTWDNLMMCAANILVGSSAWFFLFVLWKRDKQWSGRRKYKDLHLQALRYAPRGK